MGSVQDELHSFYRDGLPFEETVRPAWEPLQDAGYGMPCER